VRKTDAVELGLEMTLRPQPAGRASTILPLMSQAESSAIRVGTASWSEPEFVKAGWYPKGLAAGQRLPFYAQQFDMVELNSSFYAIPSARMCARWVQETPEGFLFDVKCHRLLSRHATKEDALPKDLRGAAEITDRGNVILTPALEEEVAGRFLAELEPLERAGKLGALLLQMTPGFAPRAADLTALEPLLRQLKGSGTQPRLVVLELRHHDWLDAQHREQTIAFLREAGVTLASIDGPPADAKHFTIMPALDAITEPRLAYLRLHGRDAKAYLTGKTVAERFNYDYDDAELDKVAKRARGLASQADEAHVVFNNNALDFAPRAAERLRQRLGQLRRRLPGASKQGTLL
jgi:uncharacterized protein YecE (DUF72 family)